MRSADVILGRWQILRSTPGAFAHGEDLAGLWVNADELDVPASVGILGYGTNTDDFDWWQRCKFQADDNMHIEFSGLTFPATVYLDGRQVAQCESMFVPVRIECEPGTHELVICFGSMNQWLKTRRPRGRWRSTLVGAPGLRWARSTLIGRAPVYGNLPAPVGIWRPIKVLPGRVRTELSVRADAENGMVTVTGTTAGQQARLRLYGPDKSIESDTTATPDGDTFRFEISVSEPKIWWPNGYGPQHLYRALVEVDGIQVADRPFGFRSVAVANDGAGFRIAVNDTPVFCRGVTWTPPDPVRLHSDRDTIRAQVRAFADAGANMVRVVGGLVYEQQEFWHACADAGLLVWQDTMLATFDPPTEFAELITQELTSVLRDVSGNPALAVVSGGSEALQQPEMLGLVPDESTIAVIESQIPAAVSEHSDAYYVPASPSRPPGSTDLAIRPDTGVAHWFGVGGYLRPVSDVRSAGVKFAAECLAFANPPSSAFIDRHFGSSAVAGHHPDWKAGVPRDRGSSWDFEDIRDFYAHAAFGEELLAVRRIDPDRYLQLGRLAVADAMYQCFAYWRRANSGCGGAIVLSGRDMQPGAGWGLLDSDGDAKAALTVLARIWAPVSVVLSDDGLSGIRIDVHNDSPQELHGELTLTATNSLGAALDTTHVLVIPPASSVAFYDAELSGRFRDLSHAFRFGPPTADAVQAVLRCTDGPSVREVLVVNPRPDQSTKLVTAGLDKHSDDLWELRLVSETALRHVELDIPGWTASDNFFHLAPQLCYPIMLKCNGDRPRPVGTASSIDLVGPVAFRAGS